MSYRYAVRGVTVFGIDIIDTDKIINHALGVFMSLEKSEKFYGAL